MLRSSLRVASISDGISGANQTNLALKGIIGIGAMAKIGGYAGIQSDQSHYQVRIPKRKIVSHLLINQLLEYYRELRATMVGPGDNIRFHLY